MLNAAYIIQTFGITGVATIIFAESGLFFGFFLPGDSILFSAGVVASQGYLNIAILIICTWIAAVAGDSVGYWFGARIGIKIFNKENSFFFSKKYPERAHQFYEKHGARSIILARFIPIVRTFIPIMAGVGKMPYKKFLSYNVIGGALWTIGVPLIGYALGQSIPNIRNYILPIVTIIIAVSFLPIFWEIIKTRRAKI